MKTPSFVLIFTLLFAPQQIVLAAPEAKAATVTLTAAHVSSAIDIEAAIHKVTLEGKRPATILLDGRDGPFRYTGLDQSINIFFSNLTIRGINDAYFSNSEGFYLDDVAADNLIIENLTMKCNVDCIGGVGSHNQVTVRNNLFMAGTTGIGVRDGSRWVISRNTILAGAYGIHLIHTPKRHGHRQSRQRDVGDRIEWRSLIRYP